MRVSGLPRRKTSAKLPLRYATPVMGRKNCIFECEKMDTCKQFRKVQIPRPSNDSTQQPLPILLHVSAHTSASRQLHFGSSQTLHTHSTGSLFWFFSDPTHTLYRVIILSDEYRLFTSHRYSNRACERSAHQLTRSGKTDSWQIKTWNPHFITCHYAIPRMSFLIHITYTHETVFLLKIGGVIKYPKIYLHETHVLHIQKQVARRKLALLTWTQHITITHHFQNSSTTTPVSASIIWHRHHFTTHIRHICYRSQKKQNVTCWDFLEHTSMLHLLSLILQFFRHCFHYKGVETFSVKRVSVNDHFGTVHKQKNGYRLI